jgi:hypothetical protein
VQFNRLVYQLEYLRERTPTWSEQRRVCVGLGISLESPLYLCTPQNHACVWVNARKKVLVVLLLRLVWRAQTEPRKCASSLQLDPGESCEARHSRRRLQVSTRFAPLSKLDTLQLTSSSLPVVSRARTELSLLCAGAYRCPPLVAQLRDPCCAAVPIVSNGQTATVQ